jgi:beta-lactamase regulating signal transducer with metallopeptidase domain
MGIGTSLILIAVGAILRFAVTDSVSGIDLATVGLILLIIGIIGLLISLFYAQLWTRGRDTVVTRDRYVDPPPRY